MSAATKQKLTAGLAYCLANKILLEARRLQHAGPSFEELAREKWQDFEAARARARALEEAELGLDPHACEGEEITCDGCGLRCCESCATTWPQGAQSCRLCAHGPYRRGE